VGADHLALGAVLRRARRGKDLTQDYVARLVGVDPTLVSQWETGRKMPPVGRLASLAGILGLDGDALVQMRARHEEARLDLKKALIPRRVEQAASQVGETAAAYGRTHGVLHDELERLSADLDRLPARVRSEILRSVRREVDGALSEQAALDPADRGSGDGASRDATSGRKR
jgi:transcriptional regulator with XRE-family HTH domain